jgi:hypothetical protein
MSRRFVVALCACVILRTMNKHGSVILKTVSFSFRACSVS